MREDLVADAIDAGIDEAGARLARTLQEGTDDAAVELQDAIPRCVLDLAGGHRNHGGAGKGIVGQAEKIGVEPAIAVEQQELGRGDIARVVERTAGSRTIGLHGNVNAHAEAARDDTRLCICAHLVRLEGGEQHHLLEAVTTKLGHQHVEEGRAADLQQRLGHRGSPGPEAGAEAAAQDHRLPKQRRSLPAGTDALPPCRR